MKNTGTLKATTPTDREIVLTRVFDVPRHLVLTRFASPICSSSGSDRAGGRYRSARSISGWAAHGASSCGVLTAWKWGCAASTGRSKPPARTAHTELFDDYPGESLVTTVFEENGGKTTMIATMLYPSQEVRDIVIKSGMEHGAAESYDRLAELLASIA